MVYFISFDNKDLQYITTNCGHCWQLDLSATAINQREPPIGSLSHHQPVIIVTHTHTHTHTFNGPLSGITRVSWYQKKVLPNHTNEEEDEGFAQTTMSIALWCFERATVVSLN